MKSTLFASHTAGLPQSFAEFAPFPPAREREFWNTLPPSLRDYLLGEGQKALAFFADGGEWPLLRASDYRDFSETGNRVRFEDRYFHRRAMLSVLVLAECIEHGGRFLPALCDGIFLLCEESGWQLPAHNSYRRNAPQLPLPDAGKPVIDLFAAETGAQLAVIFFLLKEELDAVSPLIATRIQDELRRRIITPYTESHFWWMGDGDEEMCNWTPWCTQNVLFAAFLVPFPETTRRKVLSQSLSSLDCFVKDYGEDGCCSEGVEYYRHAALCLFNAVSAISAVTGGLLDDVWREQKIHNMAEYVRSMHIPQSAHYFNFADCSPAAGRAGAREFLFGKKVASEALCSFAAEDWRESSAEEKLCGCGFESCTGNNLFYIVQSLSAARELDSFVPSVRVQEEQSQPVWYESTGIFILHRGNYSLAAKAGCNGDSHNHNDTGSFILYKGAKPFIIDVGVESYTKQTFSAQRYEIWTMQSAWHNLPTVNGVMQEAGAEYHASDVRVAEDGISMDIARAYPPQAGLCSYVRELRLSGNGAVLHDVCRTERAGEVVLSLMLSEKPDVKECCIRAGTVGEIRLDSPSAIAVTVERVAISDARLRRAWPDSLYRVLVSFRKELTVNIL